MFHVTFILFADNTNIFFQHLNISELSEIVRHERLQWLPCLKACNLKKKTTEIYFIFT